MITSSYLLHLNFDIECEKGLVSFKASQLDRINMTKNWFEYDQNQQTLAVLTRPKNDTDEC